MRSALIIITSLLLVIISCNSENKQLSSGTAPNKVDSSVSPVDSIISIDLKKYYDSADLEGHFQLYNPQTHQHFVYNPKLMYDTVTPASTFNIVTAMIALEEDILTDESSLVKWNGTISRNPDAIKDIPLTMAFRRNIDWFFWELRKKIGTKMHQWLSKMEYGDYDEKIQMSSLLDTIRGRDTFFVVPPLLHMTPLGQLDFIKRLYNNDLPFSKRTIGIVKKIMFEKEINGYLIYGKRGSYRLRNENKYIGWFIGYAERKDQTCFFINYLNSPDLNHPFMVDAQKNVFFEIFQGPQIQKLLDSKQ